MFEVSSINSGLSELTLLKRIAFGASCCERLLPNYAAFSLTEKWGDFQKLRDVLDEIWLGLNDEDLSEVRKVSLDELIRLAPDTEDFSTLFTSLAGDAVAAIVYTIEICLDESNSLEKLSFILQAVQNSFYEYLVVVNDPKSEAHTSNREFENFISQSPLMLAELESQTNDLMLLKQNSLNENIILQLKSLSSKTGIQPLKRGLFKDPTPA